MFDDHPICPYTGLRSFTEEESLYFKGREDHIVQATAQLQRNKFLMLTGASGDGKSSLVYAGIIPNARAGFLKSKYTQWCVADFRPERTPFQNLCKALARQLDIPNAGTVESELQHGFSAVIDLYRSSKRFVDTESLEWQRADDKGRAALKREAANLIILVDQFEEFFTNPENYHRGVPSRESNLTLNLLLETARIALETDLPVYVVFTMRSDFIGQCAAFRSLPEFIGFSQFFVPRLNRQQLQQVIEEPATLSGNRITRRLTERLIHDIAEGVDQLPILQHALNQIWHAAGKGTEEMDLLHYAMVGGIRIDELPEEQVGLFKNWFNQLTDRVKTFYREPNLQNVLDTHANKLYESAAEAYRTKTVKPMPDETAKAIIRKTFTCLTKIDQSRAVRNRMTLIEISQILNRSDVDAAAVGNVLDIFREPGNTFIRPFLTEEASSEKLEESDVLDITHESLIRNWELLDQWAKEEFTNYTISQDFEQQLNHWLRNNKSDHFLLSIGPLTYFETWYNQVNPNTYWIARYLPEEIESSRKIADARQILDNGREFLRRSARRHAVTRAIVRYGPGRIVAAIGILAILVLSSFGINRYLERRNAYVLESIKDESIRLAANRLVTQEDRAILLGENVRLGLTTIPLIAKGITDPIERVNSISSMGAAMVCQGRQEPRKEIYQSLSTTDSLLELFPVSLETPRYADVLRETNNLMVTLELAYRFNPSPELEQLMQHNARRTANWVLLIATGKPKGFTQIQDFDMGIEQANNHQAFQPDEIDRLISLLSPLENPEPGEWIKTKFARDIFSERGLFNYGIAFNGLYQELAYLYAASGNVERTLQCVDTLLKYNQKYHQRNYAAMPDHGAHIAGTFYDHGHQQAIDQFVKGYCSRLGTSQFAFYRMLTALSRVWQVTMLRLDYFPFMNRFANNVLMLGSETQKSFFFRKYRQVIRELPDADDRNFYLALSYKDEGINLSMVQELRTGRFHSGTKDHSFDSAFLYYRRVSKAYLDHRIPMYNGGATEPSRYLFAYPDYQISVIPNEPRGNYDFYNSPSFLDYVLRRGLFNELYPSDDELRYIDNWLEEYRPFYHARFFSPAVLIPTNVVKSLIASIEGRSQTTTYDFSELYLLLGNELARTDSDSGAAMLAKAKPAKLLAAAKTNGGYGMNQIATGVAHFVKAGDFDHAFALVAPFRKPDNRSALYARAAQLLLLNNDHITGIDRLIDSARAEMLRVETANFFPQSRYQLPFALALRQSEGDLEEGTKIIRNVELKFAIQEVTARSLAFHGRLFEARQQIPEDVSALEKAAFLWYILYGYAEGQLQQSNQWNSFTFNHRPWYTRQMLYVDESR